MIVMSFAQTAWSTATQPQRQSSATGNGPPVIVPIAVGLACGLVAGLVNGLLIAYTKIPPFIRDAGHDGVGPRCGAVVVGTASRSRSRRKATGNLANATLLGTLTSGF